MSIATFAIAVSVLMHVTWNLLARQSDPRSNFMWWGVTGHLILLGPFAFLALIRDANWTPTLAGAILISGVANSAYFLGLRGAYRHGPVALVYPIARSSPLLIALWSVLFFNETLAPIGWTGILVSVAGLIWLGLTARGGDTRHALAWAVLAALCTSVYSLSDKVAVTHLPTFGSQLGFVSAGLLTSWCLLSLLNLRETGHWVPARRPPLLQLAVGSLCIGISYALVVHAMQYLPAAYVVTLTNVGLVLATLISIFVFGDRDCWRARLLGTGVLASGIALVALARS
ncbi:MAG TPA: EamA family transporter [Azoarcus taiwanensis]|nr:EamA family transporter [Azoarcus taiwanensis]